jgi:hypothetical protein
MKRKAMEKVAKKVLNQWYTTSISQLFLDVASFYTNNPFYDDLIYRFEKLQSENDLKDYELILAIEYFITTGMTNWEKNLYS